MLDTINYTQSNGVWTKTITNTVTDIPNEIAALQAQLAAFQAGQETDPSDEVATAITNYQQQIAILEAN